MFDPAGARRVASALRAGAAAVLPNRPVTDSIKAVDGRGIVTATLDRAELCAVQYPRGFRADVLTALMNRAEPGSFDELRAALSAGLAVELIEGDAAAFSVVLPRDADYLAAVIADGRTAADG